MPEIQPHPMPRRQGAFGWQDVWVLLVGSAVVVLLYLGLNVKEALEAPATPAPPAPRAPLWATLVVGTVKVAPTKADGARWDVGAEGLPDPRVLVVNHTRNTRHRTGTARDTLEATFDAPTVAVREGDEISLRVEDVDIQFDDLIGEHRFRVTAEMIERGDLTLTFGQVQSLTLRFAR